MNLSIDEKFIRSLQSRKSHLTLFFIVVLTHHCEWFEEKDSKDLSPILLSAILIYFVLMRETYSEFLYVADFILCWICCLSIGMNFDIISA